MIEAIRAELLAMREQLAVMGEMITELAKWQKNQTALTAKHLEILELLVEQAKCEGDEWKQGH